MRLSTPGLWSCVWLVLWGCNEETGDPPMGGSGPGGASNTGAANTGAGNTGAGDLGGAGGDGQGGQGGSGGAAPICPVEWAVGFHEELATSLTSSAVLPGGDIVLAGGTAPVDHFYDNTGYYAKPLLVRLSPSGQEVWRKVLPATGEALVADVVTGSNGTIFVAGSFTGDLTFGATTLTAAGADVFVAALAPDGSPLWAHQYGDSSSQRASQLAIDSAGDLVLGGEFYGSLDLGGAPLVATLGPDLFLARLSATGDHLASRAIANAEFDFLWSLDVTPDDRVVVGAEYIENQMGGGFVAAYSPDLASELFHYPTQLVEAQVRAAADGSVVVAGSYLSLFRLDQSGALVSSAQFDAGTFGLIYPRLAVTPDGLACLTGAAMSQVDLGDGPLLPDGDGDAIVACYDANWVPQFTTLIDGGTWSAVGRYLPLGPGSAVVAGQYEGGLDTCGGSAPSLGVPDAFAARLAY